MIPYFQFNTILLGPIQLQVWGIFVALGLLAAVLFAYKLARKYLLSGEVILDLAVWILLGGLLMARVFHVVFYEPVYYLANPFDVLKFWQGGASSLGGFVGAALMAWLFIKKRKFKYQEILPYFDIAVLSLWLGWAIGRLGCFMIHDHPGRLSNFFLVVNFPNGARHDLGLYDSLLALILFISYGLLFKKLVKWRWGLAAVLSFMDYALARFFLDWLRADTSIPGGDIRYLFLTPAQWGMAVVFLLLTAWLVWYYFRGRQSISKTKKIGGFA